MLYFTTGNKHITPDGIIYALEITNTGEVTLAITDLTGSTVVVNSDLFYQYLTDNKHIDLRQLCEDYELDYPVIALLFSELLAVAYFDNITVH